LLSERKQRTLGTDRNSDLSFGSGDPTPVDAGEELVDNLTATPNQK